MLNEKTGDGYEIVTVSFGVNMWWMPTAYVTICKHSGEAANNPG
ncbi:MAG: hypothetical protein ACM3O8_00650 [Methylococcaceae bacterium]|nr:hypothetical protein [Prolixibacteraceae bacterium]